MTPTAELLQAVRDLLDAAPTTAPEELAARAEALRARVEEALFGADGAEALGLLNDAVVSIILHARAVRQGDAERAEECLEQAGLFLAAARASPPAPLRSGEGRTAEGTGNAEGSAPSTERG
ncbi:MAG: hypothetical protein FJX75_17920 [Armatimonadetes bacterium]|nr:hypothetical protein [Armatimonadota bacterium]